jgi:FtsH-binding integral membrane protein
MFFFNGRIRNTHIVPGITRDRPYTHKVGHSCTIVGCLSVVIGLIFIIISIISETKKTKFISIGIISLSVGFILTILVSFYTKFNTCYHNWAYGPHGVSNKIDNMPTITIGAISISPLTNAPATTKKIESMIPLSNVGLNKVIITSSAEIGKAKTNTDNVT